ncbi:RNA polymerase sigma factor [Nonomuraea indica]|uniref:RNA polymerase sigma factor n=1 Tax=Nonomuraea indica TaxID=1581193 RepID=UPI000C7E5B12|nr:sigma-70 family RNA polymerase sigma factor [Nonomuraea indica]
MNDRVLVQALRADDPGALAELFDSHAESIYRYCWSLLHHSDNAQVALRDTLIAAHAHAGSLSDPGRLRPWLYALARRECLRRRLGAPAGDAGAAEPRPGTGADADLRVMAWNATRSLSAADREILELSAVHGLSVREIAAVLGLPSRQVEAARDEARGRLRDAITAEVLAAKGPYDCKVRAAVLTGFTGRLTPRMREELVQHLPGCATCSPHRSRQVSEAKVFELLPQVTPPGALKVRVLSYFADPELTPYRRYVARRSGALDSGGFPLAADQKARRWPHALACALAAVATVVAMGVIFTSFGGGAGGLPGVASAALPTGPVVHPPGGPPTAPDARAQGRRPDGSQAEVLPVANASPAYPVGMVHPSTPASAPVAWPTHGAATTAATTGAATPPRTPAGSGTPSLTPPAHPGGPPDDRPREHQSRGPGATPCPTGKPTRTPPPRPTRTPRPTSSATPPASATPTVTPTPTPTPTTPATGAPAPSSSGSAAP